MCECVPKNETRMRFERINAMSKDDVQKSRREDRREYPEEPAGERE